MLLIYVNLCNYVDLAYLQLSQATSKRKTLTNTRTRKIINLRFTKNNITINDVTNVKTVTIDAAAILYQPMILHKI